jgi:hypothetical protein
MGSKALGLCQPTAERPAAPEPALPSCPPDVAARVLAALLPHPVGADEVLARAVGLGLLRQPPPGEPARLTPLALARLFLAGYRVPAHVGAGSLPVLRNHLLAGRSVFVLFDNQGLEPGAGPAGLGLLRVQRGADEAGFLVGAPGDPTAGSRLLDPETFARGWAPAGNFLVAALRRWGDLQAEGKTFFGGTRDRDGAYHWDTAECATDGEGRVLRF